MMRGVVRMLVVVVMMVVMVGMNVVNAADNITVCNAQIAYLESKDPLSLGIMVDATGKALNDLGKWDECKDLGSVAHYCTLSFVDAKLGLPTPYLGLCLPSDCSASDIEKDLAYKFTDLQGIIALIEYKTGITAANFVYNCAAPTPSVWSRPGGIVLLLFSILIGILVVMGTLLDGFDANWWPEVDATANSTSSLGGIQDAEVAQPLLHKKASQKHRPALFEFLVSFSVARNFKSLVGPSPPALSFLNGMRAISISWVILGHSLDYMNYAGLTNYAHLLGKDVLHPAVQAFPGAEFAVDSFFWLSGFLVTYLTIKELRTKKRVNWFLYYFHRIWRLSPAYFYALFFYMFVSVYLSDGPMWPRYMDNVEQTCGKYWWTNVLYVNNFIPWGNWQGQCFLWGWYLAVDMQLYIVAPLVFVLYYKNKYAGWIVVMLGIVGTTVANGVIAGQHDLLWNDTDPHVYMSLVYGKPYTRAAPWLLGIACAFLYLEQRQIKRVVVYAGWIVSATVMALCVYGPAGQFKENTSPLAVPPINTWKGGHESIVYFTLAKLGWSLALSFMMYSMAMGHGGFIRRFLGADMWNPLARLTYSAYLFHPIIMFVVYYSHLQYFTYDHFYISVIYVGILFLAFCTAVIVFLGIERPMTNMEKLFLHKKH